MQDRCTHTPETALIFLIGYIDSSVVAYYRSQNAHHAKENVQRITALHRQYVMIYNRFLHIPKRPNRLIALA